MLGIDIGPSEAETFWPAFLRKLARRGLRGVKLVISDAHEGIKASVAKVMNATWQRCRVHFLRNVLAHAGCSGQRVVSAFITTAFAQDDAEAARQQWRRVADQFRPKVPKLAALMDEAEPDVLAYMGFPAQHWVKLHSTNPLERPSGEVKRRTEVVGIFPNEAANTRLVGAILLEQNDKWAVQNARYITLESIAPISMIPSSACRSWQPDRPGPTGDRGGPAKATPRQGTRPRPFIASHPQAPEKELASCLAAQENDARPFMGFRPSSAGLSLCFPSHQDISALGRSELFLHLGELPPIALGHRLQSMGSGGP